MSLFQKQRDFNAFDLVSKCQNFKADNRVPSMGTLAQSTNMKGACKRRTTSEMEEIFFGVFHRKLKSSC
jgi:hypothetical protein